MEVQKKRAKRGRPKKVNNTKSNKKGRERAEKMLEYFEG